MHFLNKKSSSDHSLCF